MGFSPIGLIVSVAVLAPNLIVVWLPPREGVPRVRTEPALGWLERAGQALCLVVPAITEPGRLSAWWSLPAAGALAIYYALWIRYVRDGRRVTDLYRSLWGIPVPMAIMPVLVFFATAGWLANPWIAAGALLLAAGHIPNALLIRRAINRPAR